jgi:DNA-binding response OmpR family regulator
MGKAGKIGEALRGLPHAAAGLLRGRGRAVLIVDPSPDHQARLARLTAVHGHRAIGASSLDGALAFLQAFPADLVLLAEEAAGPAPMRAVAELVGKRPTARIAILTPRTLPDDEPGVTALEYVPSALSGERLTALLS